MGGRIWKFSLLINDLQTVPMPEGSRILCVQTQNGQPQLWALVDPEEPNIVERVIITIGTGNPIEIPLGEYIGTYQALGGNFVGHVFEAPKV